jgi:membrane-bound serine protease (ClpP class)
MPGKNQGQSVRGYTIYAIIGTIVELTLLLTAVLWLLPLFGIVLPLWITGILLAIVLGTSCFTYYMGRRALRKKVMYDLESMVGIVGTVLESFEHSGYVKIGNELWRAISPEPVKTGDQVVVTGVNGFRIEVAPRSVAGR